MDWNLLKIFLAINQTGNLSGAASKLGVNHSTIFRKLNTFEDEIGGRLFERHSNRYELTSMGEELLLHAQSITDSFDDVERYIVGKDFQPKGTVKITAPFNIAYRYLPFYVTTFNNKYPDIQIEILSSNQEYNMGDRQADIAVRATPSPPEHLVGRQVCSIRWSVYGSKTYEERFGLPNNYNDLRNHLFIGATGAMQTLPAFIWLEQTFSQNIATRCDELVAMSYFTEAGQGLALLPDDQQRPEIEKLFPLNPVQTSNLWLLTHPDIRDVERIKLVMRYLAKAFMAEESLQGLPIAE